MIPWIGVALLTALAPVSALAQTLIDTMKISFPDVVFEKALKAAEAGDASAQFITATLYYNGRNVARDYREAARWYEHAADQGIHAAQVVLGQMYGDGNRVPSNYEKSLKFFRLAIQTGHPVAQYGIGRMYLEGKGSPVDTREASRWLEKAAAQGHAAAQELMGDILAEGLAGNKDLIEAYKWYSLSATGGQASASSKRDKLQKSLSPAEITKAQDRAAVYQNIPNYYQKTLEDQRTRIETKARELAASTEPAPGKNKEAKPAKENTK